MRNANKLQSGIFFQPYVRYASFLLLFLISVHACAQEKTNTKSFGIHAGINTAFLGGGFGPSFSLHGALRTEKVLQYESMLFFDSHSGPTFLTGYSEKDLGLGLMAGFRINFLPKSNWNPSFIVMGGVMYSSHITTKPEEDKGVSGAFSLGISNTFYHKHMVSLGATMGQNIGSIYLKYGFWI